MIRNITIKSLGVAFSFTGLVACTNKDRDVSQELVRSLADNETILEYDGGKITAADVKERMAPRLQQAREALLNDYVRAATDALVAKKAAPAEAAGALEISDYELFSYMKANRIPETQAEQIRAFLVTEKKRLGGEERKRGLLASLNVRNKLGVARVAVDAESGAPQTGNGRAKSTIHLFCDFANPLCNRARLLIATTRNEFGDKINWVYHFFPVASNAGSYDAAIFALCSQDQGQFWLTHDKLLDNGPAVAKGELSALAAGMPNLDAAKFMTCTKSEDAKTRIDREVKAAMDLGLTSTPAYFVDDIKVEDAEKVTETIRAQIAR